MARPTQKLWGNLGIIHEPQGGKLRQRATGVGAPGNVLNLSQLRTRKADQSAGNARTIIECKSKGGQTGKVLSSETSQSGEGQ